MLFITSKSRHHFCTASALPRPTVLHTKALLKKASWKINFLFTTNNLTCSWTNKQVRDGWPGYSQSCSQATPVDTCSLRGASPIVCTSWQESCFTGQHWCGKSAKQSHLFLFPTETEITDFVPRENGKAQQQALWEALVLERLKLFHWQELLFFPPLNSSFSTQLSFLFKKYIFLPFFNWPSIKTKALQLKMVGCYNQISCTNRALTQRIFTLCVLPPSIHLFQKSEPKLHLLNY